MAEDHANAGNPPLGPPPKVEPKKRRHRVWGFIILLALLGLAALLFFRYREARSKKTTPPPPVMVGTAAVTNGDIGVYVNALGTVTPLNTVTIASQANGELISVNYNEGQLVEQGDLLAEIDPAPYQAQLTAAQGQYERDKAVLEGARINLERYQAAFKSNAVPRQQVEDQRATVHQNEGAVKFDLGQVENAKVQLAYTRILSPISGRIGLRLVDRGNIIQSGSSNRLAVITQLQPITVIFNVAEDQLSPILEQWRKNQPMPTDVFDRTRQRKIATGKLLTLDNQIDTATGTLRLRAIFTNEQNELFPNQFVNTRLLVETLRGVPLLPSSSIQLSAQGPFVYVIKPDQTVTMRPVTVTTAEGNVSAVKGVEQGEIIAMDNFNRLQEGMKVVPRLPSESGQKNANQKGGS